MLTCLPSSGTICTRLEFKMDSNSSIWSGLLLWALASVFPWGWGWLVCSSPSTEGIVRPVLLQNKIQIQKKGNFQGEQIVHCKYQHSICGDIRQKFSWWNNLSQNYFKFLWVSSKMPWFQISFSKHAFSALRNVNSLKILKMLNFLRPLKYSLNSFELFLIFLMFCSINISILQRTPALTDNIIHWYTQDIVDVFYLDYIKNLSKKCLLVGSVFSRLSPINMLIISAWGIKLSGSSPPPKSLSCPGV